MGCDASISEAESAGAAFRRRKSGSDEGNKWCIGIFHGTHSQYATYDPGRKRNTRAGDDYRIWCIFSQKDDDQTAQPKLNVSVCSDCGASCHNRGRYGRVFCLDGIKLFSVIAFCFDVFRDSGSTAIRVVLVINEPKKEYEE